MDQRITNIFSINRKMIPMKVHYFLFNAATAPIALFCTTIAKQLGYTGTAVGVMFTIIPIATIVFKSLFSYTSDMYRLRKTIFQLSLVVNLLANLSMIITPSRHIDGTVNLVCGSDHRLGFFSCESDYKFPRNMNNFSMSGKGVQCRLSCAENDYFNYHLCHVWNVQSYCSVTDQPRDQLSTVSPSASKEFSFVSDITSLYLTKNQACLNAVISRVYFARDNISREHPECESNGSVQTQTDVSIDITSCKVTCDNPMFMAYFNPIDYSVFLDEKFWLLLLLLLAFFSSMVINICLSDTSCLELLGDDAESYGFTRSYSAVGWGMSSLFGGWITDKYSEKSETKNYTPILMCAVAFMVCDLFVSIFIDIRQPRQSRNVLKDVGRLFKNIRIITFTVCCCYVGINTALIWQYLFWLVYIIEMHLEDISTSEDLQWSKTLQGMLCIVGTFFSEIPIVMLSGIIIKNIGHINTISVVLLTLSLRMFLYSALKKVVWTLPIELLSGVTYGLFYTDITSYSTLIAPSGTETTVLSIFSSAFDGVGVSLGSLIGGYMYDKYKGAMMYFAFSMLTLVVFVIHIFTKFAIPDVVKTP